MHIHIPYGRSYIAHDFPAASALLESRMGALRSTKPGQEIVLHAMAQPYGGRRLSQLAQGKRNAVLIISDHTRPVPSRDILPPMLQELRAGNPDIAITLLVATGFHRGTTQAELQEKLGAELFARETVVVHDCQDASSNVQLGILPSGAPLIIDRLAAEADLLLAEGFIEPHFFAGFSGGRKSVLPGICDRMTVLGNHCSAFIHNDYARTGILTDNPIHRDMLAAAQMAKLAYIVNVVIDEEQRTVAAFAGDPFLAHQAGCEFLQPYCQTPAAPADIVVVGNGGAPMDQNIYQSVKGLSAAEATARPGAVLIICAECADGNGSEDFYRMLADCETPQALYDSIMAIPQQHTLPDQWEAQVLARILIKHRVLFVTRPELESTVRNMKMEYAPTLAHAMQRAQEMKGSDASVAVIPNGISVIVQEACS